MSTSSKWLRGSILVGIFALLFIPLIVTNSFFFPFITGKNFFFRIVVELIGLLWVILALTDTQFRPKKSWITWSILAFTAVMAIADIFSMNPFKSFLSNYERMEGWITLAHLALYFLVAGTVLTSEKIWTWFFQTSVGVSIIICIYGFFQLAGAATIHQSGSRVDASFGNSAYLAVYMIFEIFITAWLLLRRSVDLSTRKLSVYKDWLAYVYVVVIIAQLIILFYTATRGAIIGLLGGALLAGLLIAFTERQYVLLRKIAWWIIGAVVVIVVLFLATKNTPFVKNNEVLGRFASISLNDGTTESRFLIWNMALKGFAQSPKTVIIGWGQESFNYVFNKYYDPRMYGQEQWFDRAHDIFFDWLIAGGLLGVITYFSMIGMTIYILWKSSEFSTIEKSLFTGLLGAYVFNNIFVFDNIVSYLLFFTMMAYVYNRSTRNVQVTHKVITPQFQYALGILAVIATIIILYVYNVKPIEANTTLIQALSQPQGQEAQSLADFQKTIDLDSFGIYEAREQLWTIAPQMQTDTMATDTVKRGFLELAVNQINQQIKDTPNDARYYLFAGNFYQQIGDATDSLPFLEKAVSLSPTKQTILFNLGICEFTLKEYQQALAVFKKAYTLDPSYTEAKNLYGLVALYSGDDTDYDALFGTSTPVQDARFLAAYQATKHYNLMMAYLEADAAAKPTDPQTLLSLAAGYMTIGNKTQALAVLEQILKLPIGTDGQAQINQIIAQIKSGQNPLQQ